MISASFDADCGSEGSIAIASRNVAELRDGKIFLTQPGVTEH
ncbi:hypothetical protein [Nonomuraea sp. bgisy101]